MVVGALLVALGVGLPFLSGAYEAPTGPGTQSASGPGSDSAAGASGAAEADSAGAGSTAAGASPASTEEATPQEDAAANPAADPGAANPAPTNPATAPGGVTMAPLEASAQPQDLATCIAAFHAHPASQPAAVPAAGSPSAQAIADLRASIVTAFPDRVLDVYAESENGPVNVVTRQDSGLTDADLATLTQTSAAAVAAHETLVAEGFEVRITDHGMGSIADACALRQQASIFAAQQGANDTTTPGVTATVGLDAHAGVVRFQTQPAYAEALQASLATVGTAFTVTGDLAP